MRKTLMFVVVLLCLSVVVSQVSAGDSGERRGEVGVQIGVRLPDNDIVLEGDSGLFFTCGIEGARTFNRTWALFWNANMSGHNSRGFCADNSNCRALEGWGFDFGTSFETSGSTAASIHPSSAAIAVASGR